MPSCDRGTTNFTNVPSQTYSYNPERRRELNATTEGVDPSPRHVLNSSPNAASNLVMDSVKGVFQGALRPFSSCGHTTSCGTKFQVADLHQCCECKRACSQAFLVVWLVTVM